MKKKLYIKPMIENIKMLEESSILAASGEQDLMLLSMAVIQL